MDLKYNPTERAKSNKGIHSQIHLLAKEVSEYVGEPKKFGLWLGITKRVGVTKMLSLLSYLKERGIKDAKYLMKCTNDKKPVKKKPKKSKSISYE